MSCIVYLSGEIHTDWREQIKRGTDKLVLDISYTSAVTKHDASDAAGDHLGHEDKNFWRDHKSAKVNAIRTKNLIETCDIAVIRFGDKYKQWNAAFDAGYASALNKSLIVIQNEDHQHALKEIDAAASAVASDQKQVVRILKYVLEGTLK